jgi:aspartate dehydrogenase
MAIKQREFINFSSSPPQMAKLSVVNVIAVLALASGRIPWVEVYADPALSVNVHEIEIESEASSIRVRVENIPHSSNPRTSYLAALSAIRLLKQLSEDAYIHVGT